MNQAHTLEKLMSHSVTPHSQGKKYSMQKSSADTLPRVISITSGKGGVGKTNLTTNLAYMLQKLGKKVLVLDADINLANVDVLLGLTPQYNLHHVFRGEKTLEEVMVEGPGGMQILPGSSGIMELAQLTESQKLYFLAEMEELTPKIDILLIDTAAGINENVIYFNLAAQERIILLTPEPTSLTDAYALIKVLSSKYGVKKFRTIINQAASEKEALSVFRKLSLVVDQFLDSLSLDYLGHIPFDDKLIKAVRSQRLVGEMHAASGASAMFAEIAAKIANEKPAYVFDGNIKFFWQRLFDQ